MLTHRFFEGKGGDIYFLLLLDEIDVKCPIDFDHIFFSAIVFPPIFLVGEVIVKVRQMKQTLDEGISTLETTIHVACVADVRNTFLKEFFLGFRSPLALHLRNTWRRSWKDN